MSRINEVKAKAAVKLAGSKLLRSLSKLIPTIEKSGAVLVVDESFKLRILTELCGIRELLATNTSAGIEDWSLTCY